MTVTVADGFQQLTHVMTKTTEQLMITTAPIYCDIIRLIILITERLHGQYSPSPPQASKQVSGGFVPLMYVKPELKGIT